MSLITGIRDLVASALSLFPPLHIPYMFPSPAKAKPEADENDEEEDDKEKKKPKSKSFLFPTPTKPTPTKPKTTKPKSTRSTTPASKSTPTKKATTAKKAQLPSKSTPPAKKSTPVKTATASVKKSTTSQALLLTEHQRTTLNSIPIPLLEKMFSEASPKVVKTTFCEKVLGMTIKVKIPHICIISAVRSNTEAETLRVTVGDVIVSINGKLPAMWLENVALMLNEEKRPLKIVFCRFKEGNSKIREGIRGVVVEEGGMDIESKGGGGKGGKKSTPVKKSQAATVKVTLVKGGGVCPKTKTNTKKK